MDHVTILSVDRQVQAGLGRPDTPPSRALLEQARAWRDAATAVFRASYFAASSESFHLPERVEERRALLRTHLLEKALYELSNEVSRRLKLAIIPAAGDPRSCRVT